MSVSDDERARLRELAALDLGGEIDEPALAELVVQAATDIGLPLAAVSLILHGAQYFAASHGLDGWIDEAAGTPIEWSFCQHAVASRQPFMVGDASTHPLVRDNPMVAGGSIRCYLGYPLMTSTGHALGTLCVIGLQPRSFTDAEVEHLRRLADEVMVVLEARRAR